MMDMKAKTNKTMNPFCAVCDDSASCDMKKEMPPLPENLLDDLLQLFLEIKMLGFFAETMKEDAEESETDDEEDSDDDKIAVQLYGAEVPEVQICGEIFLDYGNFPEEFECLDEFMGERLTLYYDPEEVERFGGNMYLTGAAVVCSRDKVGNLCSLSAEDIYNTLNLVKQQFVTIRIDGENIPALRIK